VVIRVSLLVPRALGLIFDHESRFGEPRSHLFLRRVVVVVIVDFVPDGLAFHNGKA
jgi:hypothetical protein